MKTIAAKIASMLSTSRAINDDARLLALQQRIDAAKQKLAAEKVLRQRREAKDNDRLFRIVGALVAQNTAHATLRAMLTEIVQMGFGLSKSDRDFLKRHDLLDESKGSYANPE